MTRRPLLLLIVALTAGCLAGCARPAPVVTVLGPWTGAEEDHFRATLDRTGIDYEYRGTRSVGEELQAAIGAGNPPDIAVLPTLGDVADQIAAGQAKPIDELIAADRFDPSWLPELARPGQPAHVYTLPIKANLKSLVWYAGAAPSSWDEALARDSWCLGVAAPPDSGWPASDWVEDLLLHQSGGVGSYERWVAGDLAWTSPEIRRAWEDFGRVVTRKTRGGAVPTLLTRYADAGRELVTGTCELDHQPSFIRGDYERYRDRAAPEVPFVPFPAGETTDRRMEVSVDVATLFSQDDPPKRMIERLATAEVQAVWPDRGGGAFSVHQDVSLDVYDSPTDRRIATILAGRTGLRFCQDASDLMPSTVRDAFYRGLLEYLSKPERLGDILTRLEAAAVAERQDVVIPACA